MTHAGRITSGRSQRQWQAHHDLQAQRGRRLADLAGEMVAAGYTRAEADASARAAVRSHKGRLTRTLGCSGLLLLAGLAVTCSTFSTASASPGGGQYVIWFGAVVCGIIGVVYSANRLARLR